MKRYFAKLISQLAHYYPLYSGCGTLANSKYLSQLLNHQTDKTVWIRLRQAKQWLLVPTNDYVGRVLYYFGDYDRKITWLCRKILRPGDTMLDIGANVGLYTMVARHLVGETGQVHAFEPQLDLVQLMKQSLAKNAYYNVNIHQIALGKQAEEIPLFVPDGNAGAASFIRQADHHGHFSSILVQNASNYLTKLDLSPIRLIKMDVEGYENEVIEGAFNFLQQNRPEAIIFELNDHSFPFFQQPVVDNLSQLDYQFFNIPTAKFRMRIEPIQPNSQIQYGHDILALQTQLSL